MSKRAFIGIGSNLGDRRGYYRNALTALAALPGGRLLRSSSLYESEPLGEAATWYINGVVELQTSLSPFDLLHCLQELERELGRTKTAQTKKWASREIDLDLLLFDDLIVETRDLQVPHPQLHTRRFVLLPLVELAPYLIHPRLGKTVYALLAELQDDKRVRVVPPNP